MTRGTMARDLGVMTIRPVRTTDFDAMWHIFQAVVATGSSYVFARDTSRDDALAYFVGPGIASWVAEDRGRVVAMSSARIRERSRSGRRLASRLSARCRKPSGTTSGVWWMSM